MRARSVCGACSVVVFVLVGCTGGPAPSTGALGTPSTPGATVNSTPEATASGDPVATVTDFIAGLKGGNFNQLPALFCPTYQDAIRTWDGTDLIRALLPEISVAQAHSAVDVTANLFISKSQAFGTTAQVHLTGNIASAANAKARDLVKAHLEAQGSPSDSSSIDKWIAGAANLSEGRSVDDDLLMTFANGTWLICGDTNHFTHG